MYKYLFKYTAIYLLKIYFYTPLIIIALKTVFNNNNESFFLFVHFDTTDIIAVRWKPTKWTRLILA